MAAAGRGPRTAPEESAGGHASGELARLRERVATLERVLSERYRAPADFVGLVEGISRLASQADTCLWLFELEPAQFRWVSSSYERLFGRPRQELYDDPESWIGFVHPEDRAPVVGAFERCKQGDEPSVDYRVITGPGEQRWMRGRGIPIAGPDGNIRYVVAQSQDVTAPKSTERALIESEARLRRLVDSSIIGILVADTRGMIHEANDAFLRMIGYDRADLPLRWDDMTPPEWRPLDDRARKELHEIGVATPWEKEYLRKDGSRVQVLLGGAMLDAEAGTCICFALDISTRKAAEAALARAHQELERRVTERTAELAAARDRLRLVTDSLPSLISYVDVGHRYRFNNSAYEKWYGVPREEIEGRHIRELVGEENYERVLPYFERAFSGEAVSGTGDMRLAGRDRYIHAALVPDLGPEGSVRGCFVLVNDLTEQRRAELELRHAERLSSVGTLAAGIAHEINNPVGVILLAAQNALSSMDDSAMVKRALEDIVRNARRCGEIASGVLSFSRPTESPKGLGELNQAARNAAELGQRHAARTGVTIELSLDGQNPTMMMNQTEIEQVILNLILNSLQARARRIEILTARNADGVRLTVSDDGEGMQSEEVARIFEPFYTGRADTGGIGLGLSVAHGIVRDHGGRIEVQTAPGGGTGIHVTFPPHGPEAAPRRASKAGGSASRKRSRRPRSDRATS